MSTPSPSTDIPPTFWENLDKQINILDDWLSDSAWGSTTVAGILLVGAIVTYWASQREMKKVSLRGAVRGRR
jgi:hypothetical protein